MAIAKTKKKDDSAGEVEVCENIEAATPTTENAAAHHDHYE